ncbi:ankyrin repeat domain-containing protein [Aspergillus undulatus]|uniref:ankyrin repeat domain-containing protein n=1 Tax=Aspergillus undulatus TaxID=1810928 RepID=UPI003CCC9BF2
MATSKDPNIISLLDKAPGEIRRTKDESELIHACFTGNTSTVKRLCEIGTAVDMETARGTPPLFHAIRRGYTGIVRELLKHGAPVSPGYPNHRYYDAVTTAVDCRHVKILRVLLDAEVPYNQELALLCTIHNKDIDSMVLLHPDPNMRYTNGRTALHLAARYGFLEGVAILAGTGASLSQDDAGMTPMDYAREQGHNNTLALLESLFL